MAGALVRARAASDQDGRKWQAETWQWHAAEASIPTSEQGGGVGIEFDLAVRDRGDLLFLHEPRRDPKHLVVVPCVDHGLPKSPLVSDFCARQRAVCHELYDGPSLSLR
jgi:hypothetical protein